MVYGGAGPVGGSGSASTIKQVKLERESELRIEVFTWYGATIEMDGATETDYTADVTPMVSYVNLHVVLDGRRSRAKASPPDDSGSSQGPRVIVVGPTDSGKSTLSRMLLSRAVKQGWKPTFVDLDIGQGSITIPKCIAATPIEMSIDLVEGIPLEMPLVYYYGHTTPRQFTGNAESRALGMVINTMGWIEGVVALACNSYIQGQCCLGFGSESGKSSNGPEKDYSLIGDTTNRLFGIFNAIPIIANTYGSGIVPEIQATLAPSVEGEMLKFKDYAFVML
ncbi:Protein CLP1 [Glycine soja]